jgi:5'-methylthioadenosine phosphorylase
MEAEIGIIGGTGIYDPKAFRGVEEVAIHTPFGEPSDKIAIGEFYGKRVAFLPRHGKGHVYSPTNVPYRANVYAMKKLGVHTILSIAAVGSLKEEVEPLDIVVPDQLFDRTKHRESTFFEDVVVHVSFANPFCRRVSDLIAKTARSLGYSIHPKGIYVCIEGPQFSTRAESAVYRALGFDIIGMTALPEAKLAREAEICYATIATVTDYDVWRDTEVDVTTVLENAAKNEEKVRELLRKLIPLIEEDESCECRNSLRYAITTSKDAIPRVVKDKLDLILSKYL